MSKRKVILCVDDEKIILNSLQSLLSRHLGKEYELEFAESPEEALEIIEEIRASKMCLFAIITDWLMPTMKGDEFLHVAQGRCKGFRTIMLSGQADEKAVARAKERAHLDFFVHKPWNEQDLLSKLIA